ncbi:MAG TPA: ATP-dependent helicase [Patescibacteria group bacterium]
MLKTVFQPSTYQRAIFQAVKDGEKSLVITACPGSGKTTTIQQIIRYIPANATVLMVAFNVEASRQLQSKVDDISRAMHDENMATPLVNCSTIHSLGNQTISSAGIRGQAKGYKYSKIAKEYLQSQGVFDKNTPQDLTDLCDKVRLTLSSFQKPDGEIDEAVLQNLCDRFEIEFDEKYKQICFNAVPKILKVGIDQARIGNIDFTDMIWLPAILELQPRRYDHVLVDEAQDLNPAQLALVLKARKPNGRFIAVGDVNQAIYGFAGASLESIQEIIEATDANTLPLSICYRCPTSAIQKAASIYSGIEAAPNMPKGEIRTILDKDITDLARPGDLILSRCTAPLVSLCLELLRDGKRATIRGRDLGKSLGKAIDQIKKYWQQVQYGQLSIDDLPIATGMFLSAQLDSLQGDGHEMKRANLQDKIDTLLCLLSHYTANHTHKSLEGFQEYIINFFEEDKNAQIILATGHRAKGLEYPRVFIVSSNKQPHPLAKTSEAITQEYNLMYVMYTRVLYQAHTNGSGTLFLGIDENFQRIEESY